MFALAESTRFISNDSDRLSAIYFIRDLARELLNGAEETEEINETYRQLDSAERGCRTDYKEYFEVRNDIGKRFRDAFREDDYLLALLAIYLRLAHFERIQGVPTTPDESDDSGKLLIRKVNLQHRRVFYELARGLQKYNRHAYNHVIARLIEATCEEFLYRASVGHLGLLSKVVYADPSLQSSILGFIREDQKEKIDDALRYLRVSLRHQSKVAFDDDYKFFFRKLNKNGVVSPVITIFIHGFLSEGFDVSNEWSGFLANDLSGEFWALEWSGSSNKNLIKNIALNVVTVGLAGLIGALALPLRRNIFKDTMETARYTGRLLAHILLNANIFGHCAVNLVGFSLGTEVIACCLAEMEKIQTPVRYLHINDVVMVGGVANSIEIGPATFWRSVQGQIANFFCRTDEVLNFVLPTVISSIQPIGNRPLSLRMFADQPSKVKNFDMTPLVKSHLDYRVKMNQIYTLLELSSVNVFDEQTFAGDE
eukprot:TRINITY_DN5279_c0_g1_i3.p1 TRINITY_DN5279_c0_g1~~TRINITY_DN5279_c0_g1_i3.p1  ORF type:complete len:482 (+),score=108.34 TRINITY_DN5279_c0_g1_i3:648-2093(+)